MKKPTITRRCHWLNKNARSKRPHSIIFLDCEALIETPRIDLQEHSLKLASASYCRYTRQAGLFEDDWRNFTSPLMLWSWVLSKAHGTKSLIVIAHNLDYDIRVSCALTLLPKLGATPHHAIIASGCTFMTFTYDNTEIVLLDNLGIWPASLEEIGKSVGVEKTHVNFDSVTWDDLCAYCRNDVKILVEQWRHWLAFLDEQDMGSFAITLAGQSFHAYRHRFIDTPIGIHDCQEALELERAAYRGGRAEAFRVGKLPKGEYFKLDVNSLYPCMMQSNPYPCQLVKIIECVKPGYLDALLGKYLVIAEVLLHTPEPVFPLKMEGKNCYPIGSFFTTLTTPELKYACGRGYVIGVGRVALYRGADLFSRFVNEFYTLRLQYSVAGDTAKAKMCKMIMNSLQGKLGQIGYAQIKLADAPIDKVGIRRWLLEEPGQSCNDVTFGGATFRQVTGGESNNSFPAIPAHVSAYGRVFMWELIKQAGPPNVFYIDTDSLIVNTRGYNRLKEHIDPSRLGALKLEGQSSKVEIRAKKDYSFGEDTRIKGVRKNAVQIRPGVYSQWHFTSLLWGLGSQELEGVVLQQVTRTPRYGEVVGSIGKSGRIIPPVMTLDPSDERLAAHDPGATVWTWEYDTERLETLIG